MNIYDRPSFPMVSRSEVTNAMPFRWPKSDYASSLNSPQRKSYNAQSHAGVNPKVEKMLQQSKSALTTSFAKHTFDIALYGKSSIAPPMLDSPIRKSAKQSLQTTQQASLKSATLRKSMSRSTLGRKLGRVDPHEKTPFVISSMRSNSMSDVPVPLSHEEKQREKSLQRLLAPQLNALKQNPGRARRKEKRNMPMHLLDARGDKFDDDLDGLDFDLLDALDSDDESFDESAAGSVDLYIG